MKPLSLGGRRLPMHHITIRVPWHDNGWNGCVCTRPLDNISCLSLRRISENKRDEVEVRCAGQRLDKLNDMNLPPCVAERASFMAPFDLTRKIEHPYTKTSPQTHGHFLPTAYVQPSYSAACVPYRWMLRKEVEGNPEKGEPGIGEKLKLDWIPDREPDLKFETPWVQERENQIALLDTFFGSIRPEESLCFFYAKRTPLSEQSRRVIIGVGRVLSVGNVVEYKYNIAKLSLRSVLWERNVGHSIRPEFGDGFLFPYNEMLELATNEDGLDPEQFVAFAPDEHFNSYSYGSELLTHDGAIASLVACASVLHKIRERIQGPWEAQLNWIDVQLNRLWQSRGAFPGLGSALSAFGYEWGFQHGSLLAFEIDLEREKTGTNANPWDMVDAIMKDPSQLDSPIAKLLSTSLRKGWMSMTAERRTFLELLSRLEIGKEQAFRFYDRIKRQEAGIDATEAQILQNPYLLFEKDRHNFDPIAFNVVDRSVFLDESLKQKFGMLSPDRIDDPADPRRVRALVTDILEEAAIQGHSVLPRDWVISRARDRALRPPCPLGENVLDASEDIFSPILSRVTTQSDQPAYQIDRLVEYRKIIQREVLGRKRGRRHTAIHDWRILVEQGLEPAPPSKEEEKARQEKAEALEQLFRSRISVLIGPAGTGKTTLLQMLCDLPDIDAKGVLLLAPTGKARVRLEEQTGRRGTGFTLAQFLSRYSRYDGSTAKYFINTSAPKCADFRTVIVDESSMLTEDQLATLFDVCTNVERFVLVGDPQQLPPIGTGRPFVDIVNELTPDGIDAKFPRCAPCYAELTISHRQGISSGEDVLFASHYSNKPLDPGADKVWDLLVSGSSDRLRLVQWNDARDLQQKLLTELVAALELKDLEDEFGFEASLGGSRYKDIVDRAFFWNRYGDKAGAASKAEDWQILSPMRNGLEGADALNRTVQKKFRWKWNEKTLVEDWKRKIPKPFGPQQIIYGDKVINVVNQKRGDVWPRKDRDAYIANGDMGIVVGEYKGRNSKLRGSPSKLEVEFTGQLGHKYRFWKGEFGDDTRNPLELAYALTVHKTQGSEFRITILILPNPCRLLSRELLYTALTRHRDKMIILHQGPILEFRQFAGNEYSEIARRMTNLFSDPQPREVVVGTSTQFLEEGLIHRTEKGILVRSKSELVIADKLHSRGIDYAYEQQIVLANGNVRYPDFTIADNASGVTFYWEHLGLLNNPSYRARWERKRAEYIASGILPYQDGGGLEGILIETHDDPYGGLDASAIAKIIDDVLLCEN